MTAVDLLLQGAAMIAAVVVIAVVVKVLFLGNRPVRRPRENSDLQEHQVRARAGTGSRF